MPSSLARAARRAVPLAAALVIAGCGEVLFTPPAIEVGEVALRVTSRGGDGLYFLTRSVRSERTPGLGRFRSSRPVTYADLWKIDAATGEPRWRRTIVRVSDGVQERVQLLGGEPGVLWIWSESPTAELLAVDAETGALRGDGARFARDVPGLAGQFPSEAQFVRFDGRGLVVTAADGRRWRLDGTRVTATELAEGSDMRDNDAPFEPGSGRVSRWMAPAWRALTEHRGMRDATSWLGVLTAAEGRTFTAEGWHTDSSVDDLDDDLGMASGERAGTPKIYRARLWRARIDERIGSRRYRDFAPLAKSPEFLQGVLLPEDPRTTPTGTAVRRATGLATQRDVLVLHRDRVGLAGRFVLTCASTTDGAPRWATPLPLTTISATFPGKDAIAFLGELLDAPEGGEGTRTLQVVSVERATGRVRTFDLTRHADDVPATPLR